MVQFLISSDSESASYRERGRKMPVKVEIEEEDFVEEQHAPLTKRPKSSSQQGSSGAGSFPVPPPQYNPLEEPSPLGLRLRKSPSLLDLIQMKLSQTNGNNSTAGASSSLSESLDQGPGKDGKCASVVTADNKLKAANFPASLLRIGRWEYKSRYEGDLVAKCYFAKHKLVWEVLEGGLKSKIEIQWSDIMGLKASCPEDGPGFLNVVLSRQPLFFRETNPQPRKHTLWQATADFTDGQASVHRQHFLQCPQGLLNKHFEKLIQCDTRLNFLSQQPEIVLDSPYFDQRSSIFEGPEETSDSSFSQVEVLSAPAVQSSSFKVEQDLAGVALQRQSRESPSPSSVTDAHAVEASQGLQASSSNGPRDWEQIKVPGLHKSMSVSDFVNHIGHCLSEQMNTGNSNFPEGGPECQGILEEIAQCLLSDSQFSSANDEKSLMSRVNSLCCLLQKDTVSEASLQVGSDCQDKPDKDKTIQHQNAPESENCERNDDIRASEGDGNNTSVCKQTASMSRKDSFGDLLLHLPRIASLPKFLFDISEEESK